MMTCGRYPIPPEKTVKASLGEVRAFMSHSWSDEGEPKHAQLNDYAASHGPDCLIWLDKACIDQTNIDASLASLPIFLAGCQGLLVLAGKTYPTRLWCVVELFVYLRMGGTKEVATAAGSEPSSTCARICYLLV